MPEIVPVALISQSPGWIFGSATASDVATTDSAANSIEEKVARIFCRIRVMDNLHDTTPTTYTAKSLLQCVRGI